MIKIHKKLWYVVTKRERRQDENNLAYMTYYEENKAFEKRQSTGLSWASAKVEDGVVIDNKPRQGFTIHDSVSRWSTQNKLFRVYDPAGFTVEVPTGNISTLLKYVTVINGVIQENCCWGREGNDHILLPEGSEPYELAKEQTAETNSAVTLGKLEVGNIVKFTPDGAEYVYLGQFKYVWDIEKRVATLRPNYGYCSGKYQASKDDPILDAVQFTETKWRHIFYPVDDSNKYNQRYKRKSSGKVIVTGKVEINKEQHPNKRFASSYDSYKDLDDFCEENELYFFNWRSGTPDYVTKSIKGLIRK